MTAALTRLNLKPVCNDRSISLSLSSKIELMCSLVTTVFLYACESDLEFIKSQKAVENRRKMEESSVVSQ